MPTDKIAHGYLPAYQRIFVSLGPTARVCEIGVGQGAGLDMLRDLFPGGLFAGVDHNENCRWPTGVRQIVSRQDDPALPARLTAISPQWDLIIDDASHNSILSEVTFVLLWPLVAPGGFYVLEDWMVGLPATEWHAEFGPGMAELAASFLQRLTRDSDTEEICYRYGLAVLRKKGNPSA